jgi:endonuclease YncB( thermonuclease family)
MEDGAMRESDERRNGNEKKAASRVWAGSAGCGAARSREGGRAHAQARPRSRWRVVRVALLALLLGLLAGVRAPGAEVAPNVACEVTGVDDAATLVLRCPAPAAGPGGGARVVRLADVVAPRPGAMRRGGDALGEVARAWVERWLAGCTVQVSASTVLLGGADVRVELLARGLVGCAPRADPRDGLDCLAHERVARAAGRGIWSYQAWRQEQAAAHEPLDVGPPPVAAPASEALGAVAARYARRSAAERQADFEAALVVAASTHVGGAAALPPPLDAARDGAPPHHAGEPAAGTHHARFPLEHRCSPLEPAFCGPRLASDESSAAPPKRVGGGRGRRSPAGARPARPARGTGSSGAPASGGPRGHAGASGPSRPPAG